MSVQFNDEDCRCEHPADMHDDGFGCIDQDCPCIAGWSLMDYGDLQAEQLAASDVDWDAREMSD